MSVKILLYTLLKQIGIFLVVSFLVFRGTFVESDSLGLNLSTGVSLLLSVILWGNHKSAYLLVNSRLSVSA